MDNGIRLGDRLRYEFDKSMAAGPIALIGWLTVISVAVIVLAALVIAVARIAPADGDTLDFFEASWQAFMRAIDPGAIAADMGWAYRSVTLVVTLTGIFLVSALIGIIGAGVNDKLDELRKGRSRVLEDGHTLILNWSDSIFDIIKELVLANQSAHGGCIVVMADMDKVEMEDAIAAKIGRRRGTRIICRSGDPTNLYDLSIVSPQSSRSVIVLSPDGPDPDSRVLKTVLALVADPARREDRYRIAAEIRDQENVALAKAVGGDELQVVLADELIARIVVQSCLQSGLSAVYTELLGFEGDEIYVVDAPDIVGMRFGDAIVAHESCVLMGVCDPQGTARLNPPMDMVIEAGSKAIYIAEDDSRICRPRDEVPIVERALRKPPRRKGRPERTLMLGWNRRGRIIASELSRFVAPGSLLTIAASAPRLLTEVGEARVRDTLEVRAEKVDATSPAVLATLDLPSYDHVIVLGYSDDLDAQAADTRTLVTLLHVRKLVEQSGRRINVVSEMADVRNSELAEVTRADDFVVSNRLVSLMLAQASENEHLSAIFTDLLDEQGSEIRLKPMGDYVSLEEPVNFFTVAEAARRRGEVALGYCRRRPDEPDERGLGGVRLNPDKSEPMTFAAQDRVVVLARD